MKNYFTCVFFLFLPFVALVQEKGESAFEIGGLILDETRSRPGTIFYEKFYNSWQAPVSGNDFTLKIVEMPPRGRAAQIRVMLNEHLVLQQHLQPQDEAIEAAVKLAMARVDNFLRHYDTMQQNLDGEEKMGNGIY